MFHKQVRKCSLIKTDMNLTLTSCSRLRLETAFGEKKETLRRAPFCEKANSIPVAQKLRELLFSKVWHGEQDMFQKKMKILTQK